MTKCPVDLADPGLCPVNLADPELVVKGKGPDYKTLSQMRAEKPVYWNPAPENYNSDGKKALRLDKGFWVVTRHDDLTAVSRNPKLFSSAKASHLLWDVSDKELEQQRAGIMGMDPPRHQNLRRLVQGPFVGEQLKRFEPRITELVKGYVAEAAEKGETEFVYGLASKLPVTTFCVLMGIPEEDHDLIFQVGNTSIDYENQPRELIRKGQRILREYATKLTAAKRENPDDSVMSSLVNGEVEGERLSTDEINVFFRIICVAGHETTRTTAASFLRLMREYPEQYEILISDLDKHLPNAIEEVLRFSPPVMQMRRTAIEDTVLGGQEIKEGDKVYLSYPAANRDPAVFEDPDKFDILRKNSKRHLAFGVGEHFCLGAALARLQLQILLKEFLTQIPDYEIVDDVPWLRSIWLNANTEMKLKFEPRKTK